MEDNRPTFVPLSQAAAALGVPRAWLRREVCAGRVPAILVGRRWMVNLDNARGVILHRAQRHDAVGVRDAQ
ncbi:MAG: hypothetical protein KF866_04635 [Phycisphaeraceae bacterium]|nr:hypothetical protein [Phycisphaeraceae bacterium]